MKKIRDSQPPNGVYIPRIIDGLTSGLPVQEVCSIDLREMAQATLFEHSTHSHLLPQFADVQLACIEFDNMVADYLPPYSLEKMTHWWAEKASQVAATPKTRHIFFMEENNQVTGVVMLQLNMTETGGFRGEVQKLLVSPHHRRKGIASRMMQRVEEVANAEGRTLMLLDTEKDSPADGVYPKWGYKLYGMIPRYEKRPDGTWMDGNFYYKDLSAPDAVSLV